MGGAWKGEDRCHQEPGASTHRVSSLDGNSLDAALEYTRSVFQIILYNLYSARVLQKVD